ncbi:MAG: hypothetical protein IJL48_01840 [Bacteroidales bacterium]|nr:hypothetical protein [Bacteroidales bacterium]
MKYYSQNQTELLNELKDTLQRLNKDNRWIRLADSLPWDGYTKRKHKSAKLVKETKMRQIHYLRSDLDTFMDINTSIT